MGKIRQKEKSTLSKSSKDDKKEVLVFKSFVGFCGMFFYMHSSDESVANQAVFMCSLCHCESNFAVVVTANFFAVVVVANVFAVVVSANLFVVVTAIFLLWLSLRMFLLWSSQRTRTFLM